ncbi:S-layer homology domain-containing protein [Anaerotignum faecicola]|nr:S-layer homology domain-containing protein [Anaerotignum faecicola]
MKKRILSILLCLCMAACMLPTAAFAADTGKAIQLGTDALSKNVNTEAAPTVYFGQDHGNNPAAWRVIGYDGSGVAGAQGDMTLLAAGTMGEAAFDSVNYSSEYAPSELKTAIDALEAKLTTEENAAVKKRTLASGSYNGENTDCVAGAQVDNAVFWPLSIAEAHAVNQDLRIVNKEHTNWAMYHWWLRSPCKSSSSAAVVHGNGEVLDDGMYHTSDEFGVRPAFNLNLNAVLFASAAVGGKPDGGLTPISEYTGSEWKLTLLDNSRNFAVTEKAVSGDPDGTLTLHYSGATTGTNEYISVILADNSGAKYYGRVAQPTEATGTVEIKIPSDIAPGSYTLKVFSEQCNGDKKTDYASDFTDIALTVEKQADEQFTLAPGGTYYFDLSAENILGTVNDALPDKTMHYVPFTYAGTVDAYTLTSERETTEEYAQKNKYPHSLFVADYAVTHTVSWDNLNTANLIFGKDYVAGGVGYTLRAPSVGSGRTDSGESQRGTPLSNEWDKILDKDSGYIKNWSEMSSWGQDTKPDNSFPIRANRGYHTARHCNYDYATFRHPIVGFRPVLEVPNPDALGADGLKVVTLALGGGKLGDRSEDIQIIVKNGESFTAPASEGLTRPDGNTENYFKWLGSDGNLYAPGESVSADVTKLTAKFAGGSSGSGGGGGSRKPSVTYYTLHFETNGGSAITDMREENNTRISLTKYVPTRQGYTFIGWYSDHNLTNQVSEVSLTKNMTVYAGWRADENPDIVVNPFTDVSEKDWFYNDAMFVYKNGLMLGTSKTLFSPHGTVTRGMMATILWRMEGSLAPKGENSFTDVEAGRWYADAITWAAENGIFAGYSMDKFGPDDPITREQLTAIFYRYADYKGYKLTVTGNLDKFEDADKITDYAKMVMQWAVGNGLIKGKAETLLDPQGTATRAEIAAMLHRFIEKVKPMQAD